jgi:hypothetical protein
MVDYGIAIAIFAVGMLSGVILVRYGINLGVKMVYQIKDDVPIFDNTEPTEQEITGD